MKRLFFFTSAFTLFLSILVELVAAQLSISLGSSQKTVEQIQGKPAEIIYKTDDHQVWRYGYSSISFGSKSNGVIGWNNTGNLKVSLLPGKQTGDKTFFSLGSPADVVLRLQGTPTEISPGEKSSTMVWRYGYSTVSMRHKKVTNWNNSGNLKVQLQSSKSSGKDKYFTLGSSKDKVVKIQGTPSSISNDPSSHDQEIWRFGYDTVTISKKIGQVTGWESAGGLKILMIPGNNGSSDHLYGTGSHKDDVLRIEGTPAGVRRELVMGRELWRYGYSAVAISLFNNKVSSYINRGDLHVQKNKNGEEINQIKYHWKSKQITLFYDADMTFGNMFSINDKQLGSIYGVINANLIGFYDKNLSPIDLYAYLVSDNTMRAASQDNTYSQEWLKDFTTRLNGIYIMDPSGKSPYPKIQFTIHNLMQNSLTTISGISSAIGNVILDEFRLVNDSYISGSRIKIGNIVLGEWWTEDGERIRGTGQQIGDITFHHFTFPDGSSTSSSTLGIDIR